MQIDPKKRFQQDPTAVKRHADFFSSVEVQMWLELAFTDYVLNLPTARGAVDAVYSDSRREGARDYMSVLVNLSNKLPMRPRISDNLPHTD